MPEAVDKVTAPKVRGIQPSQIVLTILIVAGGWVYWPAVKAVLRSWEFDYDHGPVLLLIALYLFYRRWPLISARQNGPVWIGVAGLLLAASAWSMAYVASIQSIEMLLLPVIVAGVLLTTMGWRSLLAASLPIAYLYFAMPVWGFLNPLLQSLTVFATSQIMAVISIPARISGNFVILPNGVFEIASGCSGLSYFISAAAIGVLYAGLYLRSTQRRLLMVSSSMLLALVANWVRVILIIVAGYQTDMQHYLVAVDHYWFGWAVFGVFLVPLFWLGRKLEAGPAKSASEKEVATSTQGSVRGRERYRNGPASATALLAGSLAAMTAAPIAVGAIGGAEQTTLGELNSEARQSLQLPDQISNWKTAGVLSGEWWPAFQNVQYSDSKSYQRDGLAIEAHWLVYLNQRQDAEAINAYNFFAERSTWRQQETWRETVAGNGASVIPVTEALITSGEGGRKRLSVSYYVAGQPAASGIDAKLAQLKGLLRNRRDAGVLLLGVDCEDNCPRALAAQHELLATLVPLLHARLDAVTADASSSKP